jgi:hypothetical protein
LAMSESIPVVPAGSNHTASARVPLQREAGVTEAEEQKASEARPQKNRRIVPPNSAEIL